jgi:hypothetical protein
MNSKKWGQSPSSTTHFSSNPAAREIYSQPRKGFEDIPFSVLVYLVSAPFLFMILTPYLINAVQKVYTGNHHSTFYIREGSGLFHSTPTVYGIEFCPSDFLTLEGEYHFAVPIWCSGVILYLSFWLVTKRGLLFATLPLNQKIQISLVLLFSSSIVGAVFLLLTILSGFFGKVFLFILGNVEPDWTFDSVHMQIGIATLLGASSFIVLTIQFFKLPEQPTTTKKSAAFKHENLIDLND